MLADAPQSVAWTKAAPAHVTRRTGHIRVQFGYGVCDVDQAQPVNHIAVQRLKHTVRITVYLNHIDVPPYTVCPAIAVLKDRRVNLGGPLGKRTIRDGATGKVVVKRP